MFKVRRIACWHDCLVSSPIEGGALYLPRTLLSAVNIDETRLIFEFAVDWGTSGTPMLIK